jgi:hypothetical protein
MAVLVGSVGSQHRMAYPAVGGQVGRSGARMQLSFRFPGLRAGPAGSSTARRCRWRLLGPFTRGQAADRAGRRQYDSRCT